MLLVDVADRLGRRRRASRRGWRRSPASRSCSARRPTAATRTRSRSSSHGCRVNCPSARSVSAGPRCARLPPPADEPSLTVAAVDAAFTEIGAVAGQGSQKPAGRPCWPRLFSAATTVEQTFLRRLLQGELRQGALAGVMADAVAKAAGLPRSRRAPGGDARRRPAGGGGGGVDRRRRRARRVHAQGRAPGRPDARADRHRCRRCTRKARRDSDFRGQAGRRAAADPPRRRRRRRCTPAASTTSPPGCPRSSRPRWLCRSPR